MRAVIYARVSSDAKGRGRSVAEQVAECESWAEREGWEIVETLTDNDRSASRHAKRTRPAWEQTKRLIASGGVDVLLTWEASRAQRDTEAYVALRGLCASHGVRWAYSGTVYDLADRSDRFRTGLDALVAEDEADRTRERVLRAMRANAAKGRPHGRRLFGYRRVYDPTTGDLIGQEPEPDEAALVREAADRFLAGESTRSIARDWNRRGIPTPANAKNGWGLEQVRRILANPSYAARRAHQGEIIGDADWSAIIDGETFDRIAVKLADPSRTTMRRAPTVRLLSGVARCGMCGGPLRYAKQGSATRGYRLTYTCVRNHCVARDLESLEAFVTAVVLERLSRPDARAAMSDRDPDPAVEAAMQEAVDLRARLDDAVGQFTTGKLTASTLARIEGDLMPRIAEAERRARVTGLPTAAADIAGEDDPTAAWEALGRDQQREIIRALLEVVVLPVKVKGRKRFDPSCVRIEWRR
jgi:site-specific DNA recombinase